jgi:probable rRNA maturation factor
VGDSSELDVDVIGDALPEVRVRDLVALALASAGVEEGHVAVEFVDAERIASLNGEHRGKAGPTDVLSFPVDEGGEAFGPRELGVLHLTGMDHETDSGEMLALQAEILGWMR